MALELCSIRAPIGHWPIIGQPIVGTQQLAKYQLITN